MSNEYSNPIGFFPHLVFNRVQFWGIVFWAVWHWVGVIHGKIPAVFTSALLKVPKTPFHSTKVICQGSAHWYLWFVSFEMSEFFFFFSWSWDDFILSQPLTIYSGNFSADYTPSSPISLLLRSNVYLAALSFRYRKNRRYISDVKILSELCILDYPTMYWN